MQKGYLQVKSVHIECQNIIQINYISAFHSIFKCTIYCECTILGLLDGHFVFSPHIIRFGGHPFNIDKYTIKNLYTKIVLLSTL